MDNITLNMENLSENEREQLMKLVKKANEQKNSNVWKPEINETYWYVSDRKIDYYDYVNDPTDRFLYAIGNCFKSKEEAEFAFKRAKVIAELKRFAEENNGELDFKSATKRKYHIQYSTHVDAIFIDYIYNDVQNEIYFSSEQIARDAIKSIGEDRLKKYYFGFAREV